tara:strand:+ start:220 stop:1212 length:993 start_codon:yes stop_codon:yes gene_type:complete
MGFNKKIINVGPMSTIEGNKIVEPSEINLTASQLAVDICNIVRYWVIEHSKLSVVKYPEFEGFWRHIHIKENSCKKFIVIFRFNNYEKQKIIWEKEKDTFINYLKKKSIIKEYNLIGIYYQICNGKAEPNKNDIFHNIYFTGNLCEEILGYKFVINPGCFFQVNTKLAKILYSIVQGFYKNKKGEYLLDLCCGIGMFGILMSKYFNQVIGIDNNPCNSELVKKNCIINGIKNYKYIEGNVEDYIDKLIINNNYSIILNPPRRGLYKNIIKYINSKQHNIKDIVYVSCNINSLKRDLEEFGDSWEVEKVVPLDQFPYTNHYEIIIKMNNKL